MSVESAACQKKRSEAMRLYEFKIIYRTTFADFHRAGPLLVQLRAGDPRRGRKSSRASANFVGMRTSKRIGSSTVKVSSSLAAETG
jgi:hypothetical protein